MSDSAITSVVISKPRMMTSAKMGIDIKVARIIGVFSAFLILYIRFMVIMLHKSYHIGKGRYVEFCYNDRKKGRRISSGKF